MALAQRIQLLAMGWLFHVVHYPAKKATMLESLKCVSLVNVSSYLGTYSHLRN
jgi:hypothetical protein